MRFLGKNHVKNMFFNVNLSKKKTKKIDIFHFHKSLRGVERTRKHPEKLV